MWCVLPWHRHTSAQCMDFLRRFLVKDVNHRISTAAALAHPFITGAATAQHSQTLPPSPHTSNGRSGFG
jgi:serine/threonine protein kinase